MPTDPTSEDPFDRVARFVEARTGMRGLGPDIVTSVHVRREDFARDLLLSDLRALLGEVETARAARQGVSDQIVLSADDLRSFVEEPVYPDGDSNYVHPVIEALAEHDRHARLAAASTGATPGVAPAPPVWRPGSPA